MWLYFTDSASEKTVVVQTEFLISQHLVAKFMRWHPTLLWKGSGIFSDDGHRELSSFRHRVGVGTGAT